MNERLTPEQIASTYKGGVKVLRRLEQYGYKIVHPDDVPWSSGNFSRDYDDGWLDCRDFMFGGDA